MALRRILLLFFLALSNFLFADGGPGYHIRVKLENYAFNELILGFHYGEKQFVKDTATLGADGYFTFKADTLFPAGVYLLVTKPDNNFIQVLLNDEDQDFTITTDVKDSVMKMKVKGSTDNELFYDYLQYLGKFRPEADTLRAQISRLKNNPKDSLALTKRLTDIDNTVKKHQTDLLAKYPNTITVKIIKASIDPEPPAFTGTDREVQTKRYYWYRAHYFDNIDVTDPSLLRSPVLHPKIDAYINKVVPQHPDSINLELDKLLAKMKKSPDVFKYYLIHFLNYYAKTKLVGFDACYVHLGKNYYCNGGAPWADKEDLEKICDNVSRLEPILIGKTAPNIIVTDRNNVQHALYDIDADYTVLFFWAPDCSHCKKAAPYMVDFAKAYQNKGVKVFAVCTAVGDKAGECWKGVEEKQFSDDLFMNMQDPYIRSRYKQLYDIQTTPQIFILDRKHEILMKRIGAEELGKVMDQVMQFQEQKKRQGK
jgi:thiol-disulfide isomerase/thioredoxin